MPAQPPSRSSFDPCNAVNALQRVQNVESLSETHVQGGSHRLIPHSPSLIPSPRTALARWSADGARSSAHKREITLRATRREAPGLSFLIPHATCLAHVVACGHTCGGPCGGRVVTMWSRVDLCVFLRQRVPGGAGAPIPHSPSPCTRAQCMRSRALACALRAKSTSRKLHPTTWANDQPPTANSQWSGADSRRLVGCGSRRRNEEWGMRNERWLREHRRQLWALCSGLSAFRSLLFAPLFGSLEG